ncbi:MAG: histidine phosphatase family protein [bacterium]|nr:histidine phosphatase family protein [bacterium]
MKQVQLVLCRHTEVDLNAQHRYTGQIDVSLNSVGEMQAEKLAIDLSKFNISAIFSSDLKRAMQTASKISLFHPQLVLKSDRRLREVNLGQINGMRKSDAKHKYPDPRFSTQNPNFDFSDVGGESRDQVIWRYAEFFDELANNLGADTDELSNIIAVGHGTALRIFLESLGISNQLEQGNYQIIQYYSAKQT